MLAVLVVAGLTQLTVLPIPAASAQTGSSRVAALAAQITADSARVHQLNVAYQDALAKVNTLEAAKAKARAMVASAGQVIAQSKTELKREAVAAYVDIGTAPSQVLDVLGGDTSSYEIGQVDLQATAGQVQATEQSYVTAKATYTTQKAALASELRGAESAAASLASANQSLQVTLSNEEATLSQVQQMASAVVAAEVAPGAPAPQGNPTPTGVVALASTPPPVAHSSLGGDFAELRQCESGGDYGADTGNGFYGAYQFSASTWSGLGHAGLPSDASPTTQDQAAMQLQAQSGWGQWPACAAALGL